MGLKKPSSFGERLKNAVGVQGSFKESIMPMIGYNSASILFGGESYIISTYFLAFLTEVENLTVAQAGMVIMFAQFWDAVTDPMMGIITDRTKSKYGRHRKYLLLGILPVGLSFFMLWYSFGISSLGNSAYTMVYYIIAYMLFNTSLTVVNVPHTAMLPGLAPEYFLRTQYKSIEYIINSIGMVSSFLLVSLSLGFLDMDILTYQMRGKFMVLGIILALWFSIPLLYTFKSTSEPSSLDMGVPEFNFHEFIKEYKLVFKNKSFRRYFLISLFYMMCRGFCNNSRQYFVRYMAKKPGSYNIIVSIAGIAEAAGFPLNYALTKKFGKQKCGKLLTPIMIAGILLNLLINSSLLSTQSAPISFLKFDPTMIIMVIAVVLYSFGSSGLGFVSSNIQPDVTDVDELISGRRREGVISTFNSLIKKSVNGLMASFTGLILDRFGFETGKGSVNQTPKALRGLRLTYIILPAFFGLLSLFSIYRYKMTKDQHKMIKEIIAQRHEHGSACLSNNQIEQIEDLAGQRFDEMWIGTKEKVVTEN
ncbi:MAG TPA: MFS transporter [Clostridia bacterium]|nr:MFS transporter [Clostridia bacterium]